MVGVDVGAEGDAHEDRVARSRIQRLEVVRVPRARGQAPEPRDAELARRERPEHEVLRHAHAVVQIAAPASIAGSRGARPRPWLVPR